jgi:hypothetical protein
LKPAVCACVRARARACRMTNSFDGRRDEAAGLRDIGTAEGIEAVKKARQARLRELFEQEALAFEQV